MKPAPLLLCLAILGSQVDKITLQFYQDSLILRDAAGKEAVPLQMAVKKPPLSVLYRKNKTFAVWDDRGLSVRVGKKLRSSLLPEVAVSPRIFTREEILKTVALVKQGKRQKNATGLSGAKRIGTTAYFLVRWEDSAKTTWLEALVSVDLTEKNPKPKLLAKLPGRSMANLTIDDDLNIINGKLSVVSAKLDAGWGMAIYDPTISLFVFHPMGERLKSYTPINQRLGAFVEDTEYGTSVAGRVDWMTRTRKDLAESKGSVKFLDGLDPLIVLVTRGGTVTATNTVTGAEVRLPASSALRRTSRGVAVWSPFKEPKHAWLYDAARWDVLAEWPEPPPTERSGGR
jgi:hypothetical protein